MSQLRRNNKNRGKKGYAVLGIIALLFLTLIVVTEVIEKNRSREPVTGQTGEQAPVGINRYVTIAGQRYLYTDNVRTVLLAGTDGRGNQSGEGESYEGDMADFLEILIVNRTKQTYALLPIDRDTMTEVDLMNTNGEVEDRQLMQLCIAHAYGGSQEQSCENLVNALSDHLGGLDFDGYYVIPVDAIRDLNHQLGGVEVTVLEDFSAKYPEMKKDAVVKLSDEEAQAYVQSRMDVGDGTNEGRMMRQKQYIDAAIGIVNERQAENNKYLLNLFDGMGKRACTDIPRSRLTGIAYRAKKYENLGTFRIEGEHIVGTTLNDGLEHMEFYDEEDSMLEILTKIYDLTPYGSPVTEEE